MSIEYAAKLPPGRSAPILRKVAEVFQNDPQWQILRVTRSDITLRLSSHVVREDWPEDVTVTVAADSLVVSFHGTDRRERDGLLARLGQVLVAEQVRETFEEV